MYIFNILYEYKYTMHTQCAYRCVNRKKNISATGDMTS